MEKISFNIDPYTYTGSALLIGLSLASELSQLEQVSVGNWLQLVGLTMQTYSSQNDVINQKKDNSQEDSLTKIKETIAKIEDELKNLK